MGEVGDIEHFIGRTAMTPHVANSAGTTILTVQFAPGACTEWHEHPGGQYLESLQGSGWVCEWGGTPRTIGPGERVWCPPGVLHRHGATEQAAWLQFSITPGETRWVTDLE